MIRFLFSFLLTGLFCVSLCASQPAADTVFIADFGLQPDSRVNATPCVWQAMEACKGKKNPVILFPTGRYDFWPHCCTERNYYEANSENFEQDNPRRLAVLIEKMQGLTLVGNGSMFVMHDRIQPFTIDNCNRVTIRDVSVDWDIPLTSQAEVVAVTDDYVDIRIPRESPYIIEKGKQYSFVPAGIRINTGKDKLVFVGEGWKAPFFDVLEFDRQTQLLVPQTGDDPALGANWQNYWAEEIAPDVVRLHNHFKRKPKVNNLLVLRHSRRDHAGIFINESKDIRLENINMHHNCGLGVLAQFSENLTCENVNWIPNAQKGRILSGHDDGIHVADCKGDVVIRGCTFQSLMDDPINVGGRSVSIVGKPANRYLWCARQLAALGSARN